MMSNEILITDSLFIDDNDVKTLENVGYSVERLDTPQATEAELCSAIKGKVGYILGGIEHVTPSVISAADELKAIAFTGTDWKEHIPAWNEAFEKGIAISNTPFSNSQAVAEWAFTGALSMVRRTYQLGRTGKETFITTPGFNELHVGIVGLGHVGSRLADMFTGAGFGKVSYWSKSPKESKYERRELDQLLNTSDIICFCVSADAGKGFIDEEKLGLMKDGAIITTMRELTLDESALLTELQQGRLRSYLDFTPETQGFADLDLGTFYCSNIKTSYNTSQANRKTSDMAVSSLINILNGKADPYKVN